MNDAMSLGIHRLWKDALLHVMHPQPGARLLDVAGGTGDIAFRFLEYVRSQQERQQRRAVSLRQTPLWRDVSDRYPDGGGAPESAVVVCDINKEMLKVGRQRADSRGVTTGLSWVVGDAEELLFNDDQFVLYTIAFGIWNVTHIDQVQSCLTQHATATLGSIWYLVPDRYHRDRMMKQQQSEQVEIFLRAKAITSLFSWTGAQSRTLWFLHL
ncbi:2-methoxy-6-polyprenyl-1,4-benzoquinol methylase, mitochondrial [Oryzias melastigma]|uniref:2-methoxy-6-polyprenyl-1,4-benzoquinol methylase, mitochondrial n=1 Tax=Oryzias melastigma TaxID=30732 RepID=UPI00168D9488|nr:2-methoxy-6-polyprenyl-1,4-benzoquinol methylase, mitochondrial [Oryzias melastigma]